MKKETTPGYSASVQPWGPLNWRGLFHHQKAWEQAAVWGAEEAGEIHSPHDRKQCQQSD